jgi:hypothetical protein
MHPAAIFSFERTVREFEQWHAIASEQRSEAPAWWWGPALAALQEPQPMPPEWSRTLGLPPRSSYAAGAQLLMGLLSEQTLLPWPDDFPCKFVPRNAAEA